MFPHEDTIIFKVGEMRCEHCRQNIEKAVMALEGISAVSVDLDENEVEVVFDTKQVHKDELAAAITQAGYPVTG